MGLATIDPQSERAHRDPQNPQVKGHSQLGDRADLDTSFLTLKKVHPNLESKFI